jgi:hypothetical protein
VHRPMHSAPVPINVRCDLSAQPVDATQALNLSAGNSDMIVRRNEVTLRANRRHRAFTRRRFARALFRRARAAL